MNKTFQALNQIRKAGYKKDASQEDFLLEMNQALFPVEQKLYPDTDPEHPFIFVFGLPRSGTTLISQVLAYSIDAGYINNFTARFWLAPVHGIRLSQTVVQAEASTAFKSDYAKTSNLADIHEFGYFWRFWLRKESMEDITHVREREDRIDWPGLKRALTGIQNEFGKPFVCKNIYGSYHIRKLKELLGKVLYVYIERDPLDVAVSILDARRKFYTDLNTWWSYVPIEYDEIKDLEYREQIAGQVYFLKRYYYSEMDKLQSGDVIRVQYQDLCERPEEMLFQIQNICKEKWDYPIRLSNPKPGPFPFRSYTDRQEEKDKFAELIRQFEERHS
jgi:hypothetical protein